MALAFRQNESMERKPRMKKTVSSDYKTAIFGLTLLALFYLAVCAFSDDQLSKMVSASMATQLAQE